MSLFGYIFTICFAECTTGELTTDPVARVAALRQAEAIFMDGGSVVPLYQGTKCTLVRTNIAGINYHLSGINTDYRTMTA